MNFNFRFAVISDLHIALPPTIWDNPQRVHLVEISIPALETILEQLEQLDLDFLLLPGDLTQHGEPENHRWLAERLSQLPYPAYVIPGNHDVPQMNSSDRAIGLADFPHFYRKFGYGNPDQLYYVHSLLPGVRLIGLNSNQFDAQGTQHGRVDRHQLEWLRQVLTESQEDLTLVMIHHNILDHIPDQSRHPIGQRYILENAPELLAILREGGVRFVFTGHLHVQDIAFSQGLYDITTGSVISYPHPYRLVDCLTDEQGDQWLKIESRRVESLPGWEDLQHHSRDRLGLRSPPFMLQLLTQPPLNLPIPEAEALVPSLRHFWADISEGDAIFDFPHFPPTVRQYLERFSAMDSDGHPSLIDNHALLRLND